MPPSVPSSTGRLAERIGRALAEHVVVERGDAGGGEAEQEAVEGEVVEAPAAQREGVVLVVAAVAVAAVEIAQAEHARASPRRAPARLARPVRDVAAEAGRADRQREQRRRRTPRRTSRRAGCAGTRRRSCRPAAGRRAAPVRASGEHEEGDQAGRQRQGHGEAVARVERAEGPRPGVVDVGLAAHPRHRPRHVDRELVRRRVLAGVQAGAAVVAEVGEVVDVGLGELEPARHRRKDGAKAFAVAAGVADLQLPRDLGLRAVEHVARRRPRRGAARFGDQRFKRLHARLRAEAAAAAPLPAMRPKAVPIVMPTPAV